MSGAGAAAAGSGSDADSDHEPLELPPVIEHPDGIAGEQRDELQKQTRHLVRPNGQQHTRSPYSPSTRGRALAIVAPQTSALTCLPLLLSPSTSPSARPWAHQIHSNKLLEEALKETPGDVDYLQAVAENEVIIKAKLDQIMELTRVINEARRAKAAAGLYV
jgi:hypothetical protein